MLTAILLFKLCADVMNNHKRLQLAIANFKNIVVELI